MTNTLGVMKKENKKHPEPGAQISCGNKEEKIDQLYKKLLLMCKEGCKFYRHYTYKIHAQALFHKR